MKLSTDNRKIFDINADIYLAAVINGDNRQFSSPVYGKAGASLAKALKDGTIKGDTRKKSVIVLNGKKVLCVGLGEKENLTAEKVREAAGFALREAKALGCRTAATTCWLPGEKEFRAQCEGMMLADYVYDEYKKKKEDRFESVAVSAAGLSAKKVIDETGIVIDAVFAAKDLMNGPGNSTTPSKMASEAKKTAGKNQKLKVKVFGREEIKKMGMGAFYGVSKGTAEEPKFIVAEYKNAGKKRPMIFVGKGITFDSGGISIKPSNRMEDMKYDMSGAAVVLSLMKIVAAMKLPVNAVFITPLTENLPDGRADKPGDILTSMAGITIEIISTDAEGRLILCDAIAYAQQKYKPFFIIDIATLTGACSMFFGNYATGLMDNGTELVEVMKKAGDETGERVWQLPMYDEYREMINSKYADIKNSGAGNSGTITAGMFLREFVKKGTPWMHLDIAGTAYGVANKSYIPDGTAATGVRLLYDFVKKILKGGYYA
ncbi:MAG: leucyl aminopeptidase [Spirochaetia bacterium]|nr:leucyl aminopeptidase [Spirochaetia bacterium]